MNWNLSQLKLTRVFTAFAVLGGLLVSTLAWADAPYRWPKDKNTNGFSYFVDDPFGNIYPMSSSQDNDWYDGIEGEVLPGVGIGKNPETKRWEMRAQNGWCTKLALHPMGDLALNPAKVLRLSALALGGGANVRIWTSPSLDPTSGDMPDPSDRTTLFEGRYRNGERVITKFPLDESKLEFCHWIVVEVGDPKDDCDPEVEPPSDPDDGQGGAQDDPDDPERPGDPIGGDGDGDGDGDIFEWRVEQCPLINRLYVEGSQASGKKYVEIVNPNSFPLELSHYYLANRNDYYKFLNSDSADRGVAGTDPTAFNAQFPDRSVIPAGAKQIVAITDSDAYAGAYGTDPDYEFTQDADAVGNMRSASVNTFIPGFFGVAPAPDGTDRIPDTADLNPEDGVVVLYYWDQFSDTIRDCDMANWGDDTGVRIDKTGVSIDGPDADVVPTAFLAETPVALQSNIADGGNEANSPFVRKAALTEDGETTFGSNGMFGHDETSENLRSSWLDGFGAGMGAPAGGCSLGAGADVAPWGLLLLMLLPLGLYASGRRE